MYLYIHIVDFFFFFVLCINMLIYKATVCILDATCITAREREKKTCCYLWVEEISAITEDWLKQNRLRGSSQYKYTESQSTTQNHTHMRQRETYGRNWRVTERWAGAVRTVIWLLGTLCGETEFLCVCSYGTGLEVIVGYNA